MSRTFFDRHAQLLSLAASFRITRGGIPRPIAAAVEAQAPATFQRNDSDCASHGYPVGSGYVSSLARPGGNVTGFHNFEPAIGGKWLGILKQIAPQVRRVGVVHVPEIAANVTFIRAADAISKPLGMSVTGLGVRNAPGYRAGVERLRSGTKWRIDRVEHNRSSFRRASISAAPSTTETAGTPCNHRAQGAIARAHCVWVASNSSASTIGMAPS